MIMVVLGVLQCPNTVELIFVSLAYSIRHDTCLGWHKPWNWLWNQLDVFTYFCWFDIDISIGVDFWGCFRSLLNAPATSIDVLSCRPLSLKVCDSVSFHIGHPPGLHSMNSKMCQGFCWHMNLFSSSDNILVGLVILVLAMVSFEYSIPCQCSAFFFLAISDGNGNPCVCKPEEVPSGSHV